MNLTPHIGPILKGAGVGFLFGMSMVAADPNPSRQKAMWAVVHVVSKPVEWAMWVLQAVFGFSDGATALTGWLLCGLYWMVIGALIGWGFSVLRSKVTGDE